MRLGCLYILEDKEGNALEMDAILDLESGLVELETEGLPEGNFAHALIQLQGVEYEIADPGLPMVGAGDLLSLQAKNTRAPRL